MWTVAQRKKIKRWQKIHEMASRNFLPKIWEQNGYISK